LDATLVDGGADVIVDPGTEERAGTLKRSLCVEATATGGEVDVTLKDATFKDGSTTQRVRLETKPCNDTLFPAAAFHSHVDVTGIQISGPTLSVGGVLVGAGDFRFAPKVLSTNVDEPLLLEIDAANPLPDKGKSVTITVRASIVENDKKTTYLQGIPLSILVLPKSDLAPTVPVTGRDGRATFTVLAPEGPSLHVDVSSGSARNSRTINR
jgi:hypothetical protein